MSNRCIDTIMICLSAYLSLLCKLVHADTTALYVQQGFFLVFWKPVKAVIYLVCLVQTFKLLHPAFSLNIMSCDFDTQLLQI